MNERHIPIFLAAGALLAACGGGGQTGTANAPSVPVVGATNAQVMGVTFSGTNALSSVRATQGLAGTPISVTLGGSIVGTGTLDGSGHAVITFTTSVPRGSTLTVTAGTTTISVVLAKDLPATTVVVLAKAGGIFNVQASGDPGGSGNGTPSMTDGDAQNMDEDNHGDTIDVDNPMAMTLPTNLAITVATACGGIVVTPVAAGIASIRLREQTDDQNNDDDSNAKLDFRGAFTGPLSFPILSSAARLRIEVFTQPNEQGQELLEIRVPIGAVTAGSTPPSPCPTVAASASPSPAPSPSPSASASASAH